MAKGKSAGAMPDYSSMLSQLQQQYSARPVQQRAPLTRDATIANMQQKWGGGQQMDPMAMQQAVINRIGQKYGQAPVDLAARQAELQQQAQMKADALRQQQAAAAQLPATLQDEYNWQGSIGGLVGGGQ